MDQRDPARGAPCAPAPARTCGACGEFLPHACAPEVVITAGLPGGRLAVLWDRELAADREDG